MGRATSGLLEIEDIADIHIVMFKDSSVLDQANIERIKDDLIAVVSDERKPKMIVSFENVQHISSAVLGMLMAVEKGIRKQKGQLRLAAINPSLMEVFTLTRLDKVFKIFDDTEKALKKF